MSGYILRDSEPSIVLTADQVDRLVKTATETPRFCICC